MQPANGNGIRLEELPQNDFEIPFGARNAAEEVEAERAVLWKRVASEVRLGKKAKAGDSARAGELMPLRFADGTEFHLQNYFLEESFEGCGVAQRLG